MKKSKIAAIVLASTVAVSAISFAGCSQVSKNNKKDMAQVIAEVDISKSDKFAQSGLSEYSSAVTSQAIYKYELVSYFINAGSTYINNYGYTYEQTFNALLDTLINSAVLTQYATMEIIKDKSTNTESFVKYDKNALSNFTSETDEIKKYETLLGGEGSEDVNIAKYSLFKTLNTAIDNQEILLDEDEDDYKGTDTRSTPTNVDTENDDYYPKKDGKLNYNVYTGYKGYLLSDSGAYIDDALDGTTKSNRRKAYNEFLKNLRENDYITEEDTTITDVMSIEYIQEQYVGQLKQRVVNRYIEIYQDEMEAKLLKKDSGGKAYIEKVYEDMLNGQKQSYSTSSEFESAMGNMSSNSFILYSPSTSDSDTFKNASNANVNGQFGFVYNILLPFSSGQSAELKKLQDERTDDKNNNKYFYNRNKLLEKIETYDQRAAWFNGATDYSFKASEKEVTDYYGKDAKGREYLFFENNLLKGGKDERYKTLSAYDGRYSFNGSVGKNEDGSYTLVYNKLGIDKMLEEFKGYVEYVMGGGEVTVNKNKDFYKTEKFGKTGYENNNTLADDEVDYSKLEYAYGKVYFGENFSGSDLYNPSTAQYKAMSAVNELQYAYTTDTGVLSNYVGYSVSAYSTSYIKEFEYAAKEAITRGPGAFSVCAGDYGWHLIYVTYTFGVEGGNVYAPNWKNVDVEGTFENLFFESLKSNDMKDVETTRQSKILSEYNKDSTVTKYEKRYKNLLDLDK